MLTREERIQRLKELAENTPETKSKRMQILVTPSMFDEIEAISKETGLSKNQIVNLALSEFMEDKE